MKCAISVIIPVWNEDQVTLARTLECVRHNDPTCEVILCEAGGCDSLSGSLNSPGNFTVLHSEQRQRAGQMNLAASIASGEILLFLHADTRLPLNGFAEMRGALSDPEVGGGAFARVFSSTSFLLKCTCHLASVRNRFFGWHLGDQALFVRRNLFQEMNGFPPFDRFEDLEFSRRLGRRARVVTLRSTVITSARRFETKGALRQTIRDFILTIRYLRGDPAAIYYNGAPPETTNVPH